MAAITFASVKVQLEENGFTINGISDPNVGKFFTQTGEDENGAKLFERNSTPFTEPSGANVSAILATNRLLCPLPAGVTYKMARKKGGVSMELVVRLLGFDISDNDKPLLDGCIKRAIESERLVITKIWFKQVKERQATATTEKIEAYIVPSLNLSGEVECKDGSLKSVNLTIGCKSENEVSNDAEFKAYIDRFHAIGTVNSPLSSRYAMDNICWLNPQSTNVKASFTIAI